MEQSKTIDETMEVKGNEVENDVLSTAIGEFGKWHLILLLCVITPIRITAVWIHMSIIFLAQKTSFWCVESENLTYAMKNSTCYSNCLRYEYYSDFENTIISEWDLICGRSWLANFTQTIGMFGVLLGSILFGFLADRFGRRPALLTACMIQLITGLAGPFCANYWLFTFIRFFVGMATAGTMLISFILAMETTGIRKRELAACLAAIPLPVGELIMPLIAYYLRSWNEFSLGIALPTLSFLTFFFLVPESPKWLISMGRLEEASMVMQRAARRNNLPANSMLDIAKEMAADSNINKSQKKTASYIDLIKLPSLRIKNLCSCTIWFLLGLSFYGSNQYIGQTSSNVFITISLAGALQIPGVLLSTYLCKKIGRHNTVIGLTIICSVSNGLLAVPDSWFYVKLATGCLGVSSASGACAAMYMYTSELFPTVARNMAMGASSTLLRVGAMIAPFVAGLSSTGIWIPPAVFGIAPLGAAIACYCLPETKGQKLSDVIDER